MNSFNQFRPWILGVALATAAPYAAAQSCTPAPPFQYFFQTQAAATLSAAAPSSPCQLSVALPSGVGPTASAFLHYRRPQLLTNVRYSFRLDATALTQFSAPTQGVQVFAAVSPIVQFGSVSNMLSVRLAGGVDPMLIFDAASSVRPGLIETSSVNLGQMVNVVRVEIAVGDTTAGYVRYWINHTFSDPPDGVINDGGFGLDNSLWLGIVGAEVGLSGASNGFRSNQAGAALVFDQIESNDDVLFFDDFSGSIQ
jgi:hypothetical protein